MDPNLHYHGYFHTEYVLKVMEDIARDENISEHEHLLLKTAIWLHDSGFLTTYQNHEEQGCVNAKEWLPKYGYNDKEIERICGMIMATKIPQTPHNLLEEIIADADLEYLGTDQYDDVSERLFKELLSKGILESEEQWGKVQVNFLSGHQYHTQFCIKNREEEKQEHLRRLKQQYRHVI